MNEAQLHIEMGIYRIRQLGVIDLSTLANEAKVLHINSLELNGIAFDPAKKSLFIINCRS